MKIAILNNNFIANEIALKNVVSSSLSAGMVKCFDFKQYVYYPLATEGTKPNDLTDQDKGRWLLKHEANLYYSIVEDSYDFTSNNSTDVSNILLWHEMGEKKEVDHGYRINEITKLAVSIGWASLSDLEKDIVGFYYAVEPISMPYGDTEIIAHYIATKGLSQEDAVAFHLKLVSENLNCLSKMAIKRADSAYLKAMFLMYFKDIATVNNYVNATNVYATYYKSQYLLGIGRGDTKAGYLDFVENTGGYSGGGGIKDYEMNVELITAYLPFVSPVDINNPTQAELDASEDLVRDTLKDKIVNKLVYGKEL